MHASSFGRLINSLSDRSIEVNFVSTSLNRFEPSYKIKAVNRACYLVVRASSTLWKYPSVRLRSNKISHYGLLHFPRNRLRI